MPYAIDLVPDIDLVVARLWGRLDAAEFNRYAATMESRGPFAPHIRLLVLLDEDIAFSLAAGDISATASRATVFGASAPRVVVAPTPLGFGLSRMFGLYAPAASNRYQVVARLEDAAGLLQIDFDRLRDATANLPPGDGPAP